MKYLLIILFLISVLIGYIYLIANFLESNIVLKHNLDKENLEKVVTLKESEYRAKYLNLIESLSVNNTAAAVILLHELLQPDLDGCSITKIMPQSIPTNTSVYLIFDSENWDNGDIHNNSANNYKVTIKRSGVYIITARCAFQTNKDGQRLIAIRHNGIGQFDKEQVLNAQIFDANTGGYFDSMTCTAIAKFRDGDEIFVEVWQNSGQPLNSVCKTPYQHGLVIQQLTQE